jgi:hypothetical protein
MRRRLFQGDRTSGIRTTAVRNRLALPKRVPASSALGSGNRKDAQWQSMIVVIGTGCSPCIQAGALQNSQPPMDARDGTVITRSCASAFGMAGQYCSVTELSLAETDRHRATPSAAPGNFGPGAGLTKGRRSAGHVGQPATKPFPAAFLESRRGIPIGSQRAFGCGPDGDPAAWVVGGMLAIDCCRASSLSVRAAICSESFFISAC